MPRSSPMGRLADLFEHQWGLVTRRQAEDTGVPASAFGRLVTADRLRHIAHGVYHLRGAPMSEHINLRAAWLQLAPKVPAWERTPEQGVVSHGSAASLYGLSYPARILHEFSLPRRRQSRRVDVRLHQRPVAAWTELRGLPVTPLRVVCADLLARREDPATVARLIAEAIRTDAENPGAFALSLERYATRFGEMAGDGVGLLRQLLAPPAWGARRGRPMVSTVRRRAAGSHAFPEWPSYPIPRPCQRRHPAHASDSHGRWPMRHDGPDRRRMEVYL